MAYHVIHESELSRRSDLGELVRDIDRRRPPVGYERLLYPWFLILPERQSYIRFLRDDTERLIVPLLPVDEVAYDCLVEYARAVGSDVLLVDRCHEWLTGRGLRLAPVGALQNIELGEFDLRGARMRRLRYMVNRFANLGQARTVEYRAADRPTAAMLELMEAWGKSKNNVIWHTALCMEQLLQGELPPGHRAFLTYLNDRLCSVIVIEAWEPGGYLMDQEFYDPDGAPLGHMEYAIVEMMNLLRREGASVLSLGATWYPYAFAGDPHTDPEAWQWLEHHSERPTLLGKIFAQGKTNYQFKKKFGVAGEPLFAYLPADKPVSTILHYWSVFSANSLTPPQLSTRLRASIPTPPLPASPCSASPSACRYQGPESRQTVWDDAGHFESIPYSASPLDLMSDTWWGREAAWVLERMDRLRAQPGSKELEGLRELFPFPHLFLTPRGRDAEALFYGQYPQDKRLVLTTLPWTSTLGHRLAQGFESIELPPPSHGDSDVNPLFQGECDRSELEARLRTHGDEVALLGLEVLNNGTGGHPVRLSHLRQVGDLLRHYHVPLVLDASRIVRNAALLRRHDPEAKEQDIWWIVREMLGLADAVVTSLTKDFGVTTGGLIATRDDRLAARIRQAQNALSASDAAEAPPIEAALADRPALLELVEAQLALTQSIQDALIAEGVPVCGPALGHAVVIDCAPYLEDPSSKKAREGLLRDLFIQTGIRAGIHQAGQQRHGPLARAIRFAFPLGLSLTHRTEILDGLRTFFGGRSGRDRTACAIPSPASTPLAPPTLPGIPAFIESPERQRPLLAAPPQSPTAIAIIGLGGRYPGADNHYEFWAGLQEGKSYITAVPSDRWDHTEYVDSALPKAFVPHRTRCQFGAFVEGHDRFDARFFHLSPVEVAMMDPQERLAMEAVWHCLEDAGYTPAALGDEVGLFSGITYNEYQKLIPRTTHSCFLTSRLAYFFNFRGPAAALDTGCASSLAAIDAACQNLRGGRCRVAVVVGANLILHPDHYASLSPELSASDRPESVPFGDADGWIPAEGVVAVLLKPLEAAQRDGDPIYAVIRSSNVGQEGKTSWFSAFSPARQAAFLRKSFEQAGISPATIGYVEAAANGSPLGDAIELEGLTQAFRPWTDQRQYCALGTVKAHVGHGEGVSTLLQLAHVLLQFKTKEIYPLLYPNRRNPNLRIEETPFRFPTVTEAWDTPSFEAQGKVYTVPRRASLSSFGGGGNLGHLILEEAPPQPEATASLPAYLLTLSARDAEALARTVAEFVSFFDRIERFDPDWAQTYRLLNVMRTLCEGRVAFAQRVAFVVPDLPTLKDRCQRFLHGEAHADVILLPGSPAGLKDHSRLLEEQDWHELGRRWVGGEAIAWGDFFSRRLARRVSLPGYVFDRQRYPISEAGFLRVTAETAPKRPPAAPATTAPAERVEASLASRIKAAFATALGVDTDTLELDRPLDHYGFDSALVTGVGAELEKHFRGVPATLFFDCGTIGEVVECVRDRLTTAEATETGFQPLEQAPETAPSSPASNPERMAEDILSARVTIEQVLTQLR